MNITFNTTDRYLKPLLLSASTFELSEAFTDNKEQRYRIFLLVGPIKFAQIFIFLNDKLQVSFFNSLKSSEQAAILNKLSINDLKEFLSMYDEDERISLFKLVERKSAQSVVKLLEYDEDSAAAVSSPHYISFLNTITVKQATYNTIANSEENDEIDVIFFHDENNKYVGATSIKDLIAARSSTPIADVIDTNFPFVYEDTKFTKALQMIRHYDVLMLPVLNKNHEMIGFISETDALNLMAETHENIFLAMVKVAEDDDNLTPSRTAFTRLPWLLISVILNLLIALSLTIFTDLLNTFVTLVLFQPMILGMAGNIGAQSMGVTILSIASDKTKREIHIKRELLIGLINSFISAIAGFVVVYVFLLVTKKHDALMYSITVSLSLFLAMFISALAGVLTPIALKAMKRDEKAASGPVISTVNDFFALYSYFIVATILLNLLL